MNANISDEFLEEFKQSAKEHLQKIEEFLDVVVDETKPRAEIVRAKATLQREIHTVKGEARMMGFGQLAQAFEKTEKIVRESALPFAYKSVDSLKKMLAAIEEALDDPANFKADEAVALDKRDEADTETRDAQPKYKKVLLLDDSEIVRNLVQDALSEAGFEVASAENISEFVEKFDSFDADVLLLDRHLPDVPADTEVLDLLRQKCDFAGKTVIILSGEEENVLNDVAEKTGADGFLTKSDLSEIAKKLVDILRLH